MIKEYRLKRGYTQEMLAEILNLSPRQIQRIEKDETKTTIITLRKIKKALDIPDEDMVKILCEGKEKESIGS